RSASVGGRNPGAPCRARRRRCRARSRARIEVPRALARPRLERTASSVIRRRRPRRSVMVVQPSFEPWIVAGDAATGDQGGDPRVMGFGQVPLGTQDHRIRRGANSLDVALRRTRIEAVLTTQRFLSGGLTFRRRVEGPLLTPLRQRLAI